VAQTSGTSRDRSGDRSLSRTRSFDNHGFLLPRNRRDGLVLASAVALLLVSAIPIDPHNVGGLETTIFHSVNDLPGAMYLPVWVIMQLGNLLAVVALAVAALLWRRSRLAIDLLLAGAGAWLAAKLVKQMVARPRPGELLGHVVLRHAPAAGNGFVAGHAATAFALASVAWPYLGPRARWLAGGLAATVAFARVYVGAHLPLDVVGGAALGVAVGSLVHLVLGAPGPGPDSATPGAVGGSAVTTLP
jgi:membrane-associated phospholipid phosphatase